MKQVLKNQGEMKAMLKCIKKQIGNKTFDFAKSSHVVNVCYFLQRKHVTLFYQQTKLFI